jgi:hypothetical protein
MYRHFDVMGNLLFAQWNLGKKLTSKRAMRCVASRRGAWRLAAASSTVQYVPFFFATRLRTNSTI